MTDIPTIPRAHWHRATDHFQVQTSGGVLMSTDNCEWDGVHEVWSSVGSYSVDGGYWKNGPKLDPPANTKDTLRKIAPMPMNDPTTTQDVSKHPVNPLEQTRSALEDSLSVHLRLLKVCEVVHLWSTRVCSGGVYDRADMMILLNELTEAAKK